MALKVGRNGDPPDITLRDVVLHIHHLKANIEERMDRMEGGMNGMERRMDRMEAGIAANTRAIRDLGERLTNRIDALEEDLVATIRDTIRIRRHVGMPLPKHE